MTAWTKRGLVFDTLRQGVGGWMRHSALTPTPWRRNDGTIRVYASFRDDEGIGRIGYVDMDAERPGEVVRVSARPVLDVGRGGCFDDNGMILGDLVEAPGGLHLFYVGFQRVARAKFLAFTGLALSTDGGDTFARVQETPVLDRGPGRSSIAAIHSARYEGGRWRLWYAAGDGWEMIGGQPFPRYHIRYRETDDLHGQPARDEVCLLPQGQEYRIGRPRVYRDGDGYLMYFTRGDTKGGYFPGCATSADGIHWERHDERFGLALSERGWDSRTICYPALLDDGERTLMFYNGNDMGVDGFGLAEAYRA
ncbi:hypothetical protein [Luteibacter aegosomatissinici]|uniref:hypothetical protein n=1 Tax=Luteibacter aegosomatissinici TaxID=2911539 RepID=UPI001FF7726E|nr:hypothetical protein [Luteibacter aegosomatissinici]UPG95177.1 hypothetical protein L2Y97_03445 [Luteibacter aegosomatissinici]